MRFLSDLMVGATGFEPATPSTPCWCATKLRYAPNQLCFPLKRKRNHNEVARLGEEAYTTQKKYGKTLIIEDKPSPSLIYLTGDNGEVPP